MRLIDANALPVQKVYAVDEAGFGATYYMVDVEDIKKAPTIEAEPVRHGRWKKRMNERTCSLCKFIYYSNNDEWNYCPNCGCKMDLEGE